jgi:hypothetical protein
MKQKLLLLTAIAVSFMCIGNVSAAIISANGQNSRVLPNTVVGAIGTGTQQMFRITPFVSGATYSWTSDAWDGPSVFSISGFNDNFQNADQVVMIGSFSFTPTEAREYKDTLIISAPGETDFLFFVSGTGIAYSVSPVVLQDFGKTAIGDTSTVKTITVTPSSAAGAFGYSLKNSLTEAFYVVDSLAVSNKLFVQFTPKIADAGVVVEDTIVVTSAGTDLTYEVPLKGTGSPVAVSGPDGVAWSNNSLYFQRVAQDSTLSLAIQVTVAQGLGVTIEKDTVPSDQTVFSVTKGEGWSATEGGTLIVSFRPAAQERYTSVLSLTGIGFDPIDVPLSGTGAPVPVVSYTNAPFTYGNVPVNTTANQTPVYDTDVIDVSNYIPLLSNYADVTYSLAKAEEYTAAEDSIFKVLKFDASKPTIDPNLIVRLDITFSPKEEIEYNDTLIVRVPFSAELRIPLSGTGIPAPVISYAPDSIVYGNVKVNTTNTLPAGSEVIEISNYIAVQSVLADDVTYSLAKAETYVGTDSIFKVVKFDVSQPVTEREDSLIVEFEIAFSPKELLAYTDTLIVSVPYAAELRIPLSGTGADFSSLAAPEANDRLLTSTYYTLQGIPVTRLTTGEAYIKKEIYASGQTRVKKLIYIQP